MSASSIIFLRHGQTDWNAQGRFQGSTDIPLNEVGRAQAEAMGPYVASLRPDLIVSSPLSRAKDTAQAIARITGQSIREDDRLREAEGGAWEGLTFEEIGRNFGDEFQRWRAGQPGTRAGNGETRLQLAQRFSAGVNDAYVETPSGGLLLVVAHGAAIRAAIPHLLELPEEHWHIIGRLQNCHYHRVEWSIEGSKWMLSEMNIDAGKLLPIS